MFAYIVRRLALIPLTLLGIIAINFAIVQIAPGGPVEQLLAQLKNTAVSATARVGGGEGVEAGRSVAAAQGSASTSVYRGAQGLDPAFIAELNRQFGFDQPAYVRFGRMIRDYLSFDLGKSYFRDRAVLDLVLDKLPVSISLGVWSTLADLRDLDSAGHRQGGARRFALRRVEQRGGDRRLRHPSVPVRHPADHRVRRRTLSGLVSAAGAGLGQLGGFELAGANCWITSGI